MEARDAIADALAYLTSARVRNFYAVVINSLERVAAPGFKTMAVAAHRGRYILCYDPDWVATIGNEEIVATLEHEVLHIILHHIPRYLRLRRLWEGSDDKALFELCSNTAADLADNGLLIENHPKMSAEGEPLGKWILPDQFTPKMPAKLDYENYHKLLVTLFRSRLNNSASKLYQLAAKALQEQKQQLQNSLNNAYPPPPAEQPQPGEGEGQGQAQAPSGQGQQPGQSGSGGQGQQSQQNGPGSPDQSPSSSDIQEELNNLDPVDQLAVQLLMQSMAKHMAWSAVDDLNPTNSETDSHKLEEHGREIVRNAVKNAQKSRGTIPGNASELIRQMLMPPTVPWTAFLHNIVQQTRRTKKLRGMTRPSKKLSAFRVYAQAIENESHE